MEELKTEARKRGLWNMFMPEGEYGLQLSNLDYAPLCEVMGGSPLLSEATNCSAPDTGNMEILAQFGTPLQQEQWLQPLLDGEIRSCFAMTEPWVASSDALEHLVAHQPRRRRLRDPRPQVVHERRARPALQGRGLHGRHRPRRRSVPPPVDDPRADGRARRRPCARGLPVFGHSEGGGHGETLWDNVRVPKENLLGEEGSGFAIAQARLGPGRIHHCMRAIGLAERALELMCARAQMRVAFGKPLADQGVVRERIAESRIEIEQARLLTLKTAWMMDTVGKKQARTEIAAIKVVAARVRDDVIDRAIQLFGGAGVTDDWPLAAMYAHARTLHLVDGPDEVHMRQIARSELGKYAHLRPEGF